jgi:hypothetical protein
LSTLLRQEFLYTWTHTPLGLRLALPRQAEQYAF